MASQAAVAPHQTLAYTTSQAADYEHTSESQKQAGVDLINKLQIKPRSTVLDLGCGTGSLAQVISTHVGSKVTAVDPDEDRIRLAKEKYSAPNIDYVKASDKTFIFSPSQYDVVFCNTAIHWIKDKDELFKNIHKTLKPGGRFAFVTIDTGLPLPDIGKKLFDRLLGPDFLHHMFTQVTIYLSVEEYKKMAIDAGFKVTSVVKEDVELCWRDLDHYVQAMHGWFGGEFDASQFEE